MQITVHRARLVPVGCNKLAQLVSLGLGCWVVVRVQLHDQTDVSLNYEHCSPQQMSETGAALSRRRRVKWAKENRLRHNWVEPEQKPKRLLNNCGLMSKPVKCFSFHARERTIARVRKWAIRGSSLISFHLFRALNSRERVLALEFKGGVLSASWLFWKSSDRRWDGEREIMLEPLLEITQQLVDSRSFCPHESAGFTKQMEESLC